MVQFRRDKKKKPYVVQLRTRLGQVHTKSFRLKRDAAAYERKLKNERDLADAGLVSSHASSVTLTEFASLWIKNRERDVKHDQLSRATVVSDRGRLEQHVLPMLGPIPIGTITPQDIRAFLERVQDKGDLSNATLNRLRVLLHSIFERAFKDDTILFNPVAKVDALRERPKKKIPLKKAEIEQLTAMAYERDPVQGFATVIMLNQGLRVSEVAALRHEDFDLERNQIEVRRMYEQCSGEIIERAAKGRACFSIPLFKRTLDAYVEHLRVTPYRKPSDYLIHDERGKPRGVYSIRTRMENDARLADIRHVTPHVLRATFATLAEEAGFDRGAIQAMMNHSTSAVTERYIKRTTGPIQRRAEELGFTGQAGPVNAPLRVVK